MDSKGIIQQGELAKYIVTSQNANLDLDACDFKVELIYGMRQKTITILKSDFLYGTDGEYVMMFPTDDMVGKVKARFIWQAIDTDVSPGQRRQEVDEQVIAFVVASPCPQLIICDKNCEGHDVAWERTEESDIASKYLRLCATELVIPDHGDPYTIYRPLITRNDEYLYVLREAINDIEPELLNQINNN